MLEYEVYLQLRSLELIVDAMHMLKSREIIVIQYSIYVSITDTNPAQKKGYSIHTFFDMNSVLRNWPRLFDLVLSFVERQHTLSQ